MGEIRGILMNSVKERENNYAQRSGRKDHARFLEKKIDAYPSRRSLVNNDAHARSSLSSMLIHPDRLR